MAKATKIVTLLPIKSLARRGFHSEFLYEGSDGFHERMILCVFKISPFLRIMNLVPPDSKKLACIVLGMDCLVF